jgi:hypothetical protein
VDAHNGGLEAENGVLRVYTVDHKSQIPVTLKRSWIRIRIRIKVESWIRIRIKVESWIRIRIKVEGWIRTWLRRNAYLQPL